MKFKSIGTKLNIIGGLFTLILVVLVGVTIVMNARFKKDAYIVNMAGLERMLTQKMSKEVLHLHFKDSSDFRELQGAMDLFEYNLNNLLNGNVSKGIERAKNPQVKQKLQEVRGLWLPFKEHIIKVQKGIELIKDDLSLLRAKTEKLLGYSHKIVSLMVEENLSAKYIDLSGRQRMLSQRMWIFSSKYLKLGQRDFYDYFVDAKKLFSQTLQDFVDDNELKKHKSLYEQILLTSEYWKSYDSYIGVLLNSEKSINSSIDYIFQNNTKLLNTMDEAVDLFTDQSENKNQAFINTIYIIALFAIVITIYSFVLTREVILHVNSFVNKAKHLSRIDINLADKNPIFLENVKENELKEASSYIADYVNKVNKAIAYSNDNIKNVEKLADEVQKIVTDMEKTMQNLNIDEKEKSKFNKKVNEAEDIAIESAENLIHVTKTLTKLQNSLEQIAKKSAK